MHFFVSFMYDTRKKGATPNTSTSIIALEFFSDLKPTQSQKSTNYNIFVRVLLLVSAVFLLPWSYSRDIPRFRSVSTEFHPQYFIYNDLNQFRAYLGEFFFLIGQRLLENNLGTAPTSIFVIA
jgi:hypothetical protein